MTDRRVQRTRALLQGALRAMIEEKGYERTTVQDIIDSAGVSRSTFYAHFADKETLLVSGLNDLRKMLLQQRAQAAERTESPMTRKFSFSMAMLRHAEAHVSLYRAMAGKESGATVMNRIAAIITEVVFTELEAMGAGRSYPMRDAMVRHVAGSFMGVLAWWLDQDPRPSPEEVDALFTELVMDGVGRRLRGLQGHPSSAVPKRKPV